MRVGPAAAARHAGMPLLVSSASCPFRRQELELAARAHAAIHPRHPAPRVSHTTVEAIARASTRRRARARIALRPRLVLAHAVPRRARRPTPHRGDTYAAATCLRQLVSRACQGASRRVASDEGPRLPSPGLGGAQFARATLSAKLGRATHRLLCGPTHLPHTPRRADPLDAGSHAPTLQGCLAKGPPRWTGRRLCPSPSRSRRTWPQVRARPAASACSQARPAWLASAPGL